MNKIRKGHVIWITGLSGSGKSTLGNRFYQRLKKKMDHVVFLDGDELRSALGVVGNYSYDERKKLSFFYCRLCKMLAEQGCNVVIATISMFHECRKWNRENQPHYFEIYLRVPIEILKRRDHKSLFSSVGQNIVGYDIPFEEPLEADVILDNFGDLSPDTLEEELFSAWCVHNEAR